MRILLTGLELLLKLILHGILCILAVEVQTLPSEHI
jgi:hypothetical protein